MDKIFLGKLSVAACIAIIVLSLSACGDAKEESVPPAGNTMPIATRTEATTTEEITTEEVTTEAPKKYTIKDVNARNEETDGWKKKDWIDYATEMYARACEAMWDYIESPIYKLNYNEVVERDGKEFFQSSYQDTIRGASEEFYKVFAHSEVNEKLFDEIMVEQDGKLFINIESREKNPYYIDSEIKSIDEYQTNMIFFTVESHYYDENYLDSDEEHITTQSRTFSLKYEKGMWKVYDFTIPY